MARPPERLLRAGVLAVFLLLAGLSAATAAPKVVATIKPVHSLVAEVMQGVGTPDLLIAGAASPHAYSLRPSEAGALAAADLVVRVHPDLESFLDRPLRALAADARVVTLADADGVTLAPAREAGLWEEPDDGHEHDGHDHDGHDLHIWLDPDNARAMVAAIADALADADPDDAAHYRANAEALQARIADLDAALGKRLAGLRETPFIVFHDAYQYLERHYRLQAAGAVSVSPQQRPGAGRLSAIRRYIAGHGAVCVFAEPQFRPDLIATLTRGTAARAGVLDPLGTGLTPGPDLYFALMRGLVDSLEGCLRGG